VSDRIEIRDGQQFRVTVLPESGPPPGPRQTIGKKRRLTRKPKKRKKTVAVNPYTPTRRAMAAQAAALSARGPGEPETQLGKTITLRSPATCRYCHQTIHRGEPAIWLGPSLGVHHPTC
jgi:hypothetical protein